MWATVINTNHIDYDERVSGIRNAIFFRKISVDYDSMQNLHLYRLALPLVIRETINLMNPGATFAETTDLSTFGFLYGTFPAGNGFFSC